MHDNDGDDTVSGASGNRGDLRGLFGPDMPDDDSGVSNV